MPDFFIPFLTILLSELGDKTQLGLLMLASKDKRPLPLFLGALTAFFLIDGTAILFGHWLGNKFSFTWVRWISGLIFIVFGLIALKNEENSGTDGAAGYTNAFMSSFVLIFFSEWGDKTQVASALFAVRYEKWMVLAAAMVALSLISILTIFLGRFWMKRFPRKRLQKISAAVFIILGLITLFFPF